MCHINFNYLWLLYLDPDDNFLLGSDSIAEVIDLTPDGLLEEYRVKNRNETKKQNVSVNRIQDDNAMKREILSLYKSPDVDLRATPVVSFVNEDGVGSGPVREFSVMCLKLKDEGIISNGKVVLFFNR